MGMVINCVCACVHACMHACGLCTAEYPGQDNGVLPAIALTLCHMAEEGRVTRGGGHLDDCTKRMTTRGGGNLDDSTKIASAVIVQSVLAGRVQGVHNLGLHSSHCIL